VFYHRTKNKQFGKTSENLQKKYLKDLATAQIGFREDESGCPRSKAESTKGV
jgi:hypothetical protein